jgi:lincosamide and streptogramin A transport system ATP-binding/permease protein
MCSTVLTGLILLFGEGDRRWIRALCREAALFLLARIMSLSTTFSNNDNGGGFFMSLINISHLTFAYEGSFDNVFEDVSFQMDTEWKLGFCGRNGRGKTTFLKLLLGEYAYTGYITTHADFIYFPYEVPDSTLETQQVLEQIAPDVDFWRIQKELSLLGVKEDVLYRPFDTLSGGEQSKVKLAALFLNDNNFPLIDEPTNHLDMMGRNSAAKYLNQKKGFILVSHDRAFLDACTDHTLSINKADIEVIKGNFSVWWEVKRRQDAYEIEKNEYLKREVKRLEVTAKEKAAWSDRVEATKIGTHQADRGRVGHLAAKMMKRSKSIEKRKYREIEEKKKLLKNIEDADPLKICPLYDYPKRMVQCEDVSIRYDDKAVCEHVNLEITAGERIALLGGNGSGKSSVLKLICGEALSHTGKIIIGSQLVISYVPQDPRFLVGSLKEYAKMSGIDETLFLTVLRKLDFSRAQFDKNMQDYSAGQKKKVLVARSLCQKAHLYIWDEPLNYIDVLSRIQIEELILKYKPTILFVEHDAAFCENIATKTVSLEK